MSTEARTGRLLNAKRKQRRYRRASARSDVAVPARAGCPSVRAAALAAEDHSAEFIAQAVSRCRILLVTETLSQGKKLLLLSLLCVDSVLDQLQQHAILAQLSALGHATHLLRHPGRQTD